MITYPEILSRAPSQSRVQQGERLRVEMGFNGLIAQADAAQNKPRRLGDELQRRALVRQRFLGEPDIREHRAEMVRKPEPITRPPRAPQKITRHVRRLKRGGKDWVG